MPVTTAQIVLRVILSSKFLVTYSLCTELVAEQVTQVRYMPAQWGGQTVHKDNE